MAPVAAGKNTNTDKKTSTRESKEAHLVQLSELAELVPQVALLARAPEVSHPHLRAWHVSHVLTFIFLA